LVKGRDLCVVGDVHLHTGSSTTLGEDLARLVRAWTVSNPEAALVFNGDLFDLDRVAGESSHGVGETMAAVRLSRILDAFPALESALRAHAVAGVVVFVAGNHDAELLLPRVAAVLTERLARPMRRASDSPSSVAVVERLTSAAVVVEHGHQADPDSAFYPNMQVALAQESLAAFPLASLMTRLLLSRIPRFELLGDHYRAPVAVVARVLRDYRFAALAMVARYPFAALYIVALSLVTRASRLRRSGVPEVTMASPWTVFRRLYLDRYLATALCVPVALLAASGSLGWWPWLLLGALVAGLAVPPSRRKRFLLRDARRCEDLAAQLIGGGARVVVFGHTHVPFVSALRSAVFANHGAFVQTEAASSPMAEARARNADDFQVPLVETRTQCSYLVVRAADLRCRLATTSIGGQVTPRGSS